MHDQDNNSDEQYFSEKPLDMSTRRSILRRYQIGMTTYPVAGRAWLYGVMG